MNSFGNIQENGRNVVSHPETCGEFERITNSAACLHFDTPFRGLYNC